MKNENETSLNSLETRLGYTFADLRLLQTALTHRSFHFENKASSPGHYERLEFLGDAVLDLTLSEALMKTHPEADEGTLSKWRASLVNEISLSEWATELKIGDWLRVGRSEQVQGARLRPRLLASAFEAVLGAVYLDGGLQPVERFLNRELGAKLKTLKPQESYASDFKTRLQEWSQKKFREVPEYRLVDSFGPEHAKTFTCEVWVNSACMGSGMGSSRKTAEQEAAEKALEKIK